MTEIKQERALLPCPLCGHGVRDLGFGISCPECGLWLGAASAESYISLPFQRNGLSKILKKMI